MTHHISLPDKDQLRRTCKAVSVLDTILSRDNKSRCFNYHSHWGETEELFESRDRSGNIVLILFRPDGCVIAVSCHGETSQSQDTMTKGLPAVFKEFIFGEKVRSINAIFYAWNYEDKKWQSHSEHIPVCIKEQLRKLEDNPETYIRWANEHYKENHKSHGISLPAVKKIFEGEPLTREIVFELVDDIYNWDMIQTELEEIDYITKF